MRTIKNVLVSILLITTLVIGQSDNPKDDLENTNTKDQVIYDDLIVTQSIGIGTDMSSGYSFGFNTMALRENNLRIYFDDTSVTSSFPRNDWQIEINESADGGSNHFRIKDITGGKDPFTIQAGAKSNAFFLASNSRLGLGTSSPLVELHVASGDTPTLRLDQDGLSGWAPQSWDVAANESNFFVRDVTSGSTLPFRIFPGSPTNTLTLKNGKVGIGTDNPSQELHVIGNAQVDGAFYFGDDEIDGNWRVIVIDGKLNFEKREGGAWVNKIEFE